LHNTLDNGVERVFYFKHVASTKSTIVIPEQRNLIWNQLLANSLNKQRQRAERARGSNLLRCSEGSLLKSSHRNVMRFTLQL
jgi:hypothetical protein